MDNLFSISEHLLEILFNYLPNEYISNLLLISYKIVKKFLGENRSEFHPPFLQEDLILSRSMMIIQNICCFSFEESNIKFANDLKNNVKNFLTANLYVILRKIEKIIFFKNIRLFLIFYIFLLRQV